MLRNAKASHRLLVPMVLTFLTAVSLLIPLQPASNAQAPGCPGNLLKNGDFSIYSISNGNSNFPPSTVGDWSAAFQTPQIVTANTVPGCDGKAGFIAMWGNKVVGEGIRQTVSIQAGHTYRLSACVKVDVTNQALPKYVRFNVRASNGPIPLTGYYPTSAAAPTIGIIGDVSNSPTTTPNQGIISTTWTSRTLANWLASNTFDTITINPENDSLLNDGGTVSWGHIDNICLTEVFPPDFKVTIDCQKATFTSSVPGATSWNWNFGDGSPNATQQNPTHLYTAAGTYNVALCVNGTTSCVSKPITINPAPPPPVITGPSSSCGNPTATYSVPAVAGVSYSWNVGNGTINGTSTGNSVNVTWNANGTGSISVTVTNKAGCSSTARIDVPSCNVYLGECCLNFQSKTDLSSLIYAGNGTYNFTASLSANQPNIVRVTANIISSSLTYSASACGTSGPVNSYVVSAPNVGSYVASIPVVNGHEVIWHGPPTTISGVNFPMQIKFPPPPTNLHCRDYLTFCVKYTFTDSHCRTCEVIRCYGPFQRGGPIKDKEEFKEIKDIQLTP